MKKKVEWSLIDGKIGGDEEKIMSMEGFEKQVENRRRKLKDIMGRKGKIDVIDD